MAAMVKMRTRFIRKLPAGTVCNTFGYRGVINEGGYVVVDVPKSLVDGEVEVGRLVPVDLPKMTVPPTKGEGTTSANK